MKTGFLIIIIIIVTDYTNCIDVIYNWIRTDSSEFDHKNV